VTDTGPGINSQEQTQVFQRFHRAPGTGAGDRPTGAGIGLALVADLAAAHTGRVELTTAPGKGSTFTVTIPITEPTHAGSPATANASITGQPAAVDITVPAGQDVGAPRVLVVEDDADLRDYLTRLLTGDGWTVHAVPDAETALSAIADRTAAAIDLVLTDVMLPGRDGLQLIGELRGNPRTARLPLIVLTARGGPGSAEDGMQAGADDYLTKPFSSSELLARLRANHELHQQRERAVDTAQDRATQIRGALDSNRVIGTATGILMVQHRLTAAQAFALLVTGSQHTNRKLRDIAAEVTQTGGLTFRPTLTGELLTRTATKP